MYFGVTPKAQWHSTGGCAPFGECYEIAALFYPCAPWPPKTRFVFPEAKVEGKILLFYELLQQRNVLPLFYHFSDFCDFGGNDCVLGDLRVVREIWPLLLGNTVLSVPSGVTQWNEVP